MALAPVMIVTPLQISRRQMISRKDFSNRFSTNKKNHQIGIKKQFLQKKNTTENIIYLIKIREEIILKP